MTHAAPTCDYYDDGLVHGHAWASSTPPGGHHTEGRSSQAHDESQAKDLRTARK
jgi:hypothetical protein